MWRTIKRQHGFDRDAWTSLTTGDDSTACSELSLQRAIYRFERICAGPGEQKGLHRQSAYIYNSPMANSASFGLLPARSPTYTSTKVCSPLWPPRRTSL